MAISTPLDITGCKCWLSADRNITVVAGDVTAWADNSTQGCSGSASVTPSYETAPYRAVRFDALNSGNASLDKISLSGGATLNKNGFTAAFIISTGSASNGGPTTNGGTPSTNQTLLAGTSDTIGINIGGYNSGTGLGNYSVSFYDGSVTKRSQIRMTSSLSLVVVKTSATGVTFQINDLSETMTSTPTGTFVPGSLGNDTNSAGPFVGHLYEVMLYDNAISASSVTALLDYMKAKYSKEEFTKRVVFKGSSTTKGNASSGLCTNFIHRLEPYYPDAEFCAYGVGGADQDDFDATAPLDVDGAFNANQDNVLVLQSGSNDIYVNGTSAAALLAQVKNYCLQRKSLGYKIVVLTVLPRGSDSNANLIRLAFNALVVAEPLGVFWDAVADIAALPELQNGAQNSTTYYNADTIHLNDAGHSLVTPTIEVAVTSAFAPPFVPVDTSFVTVQQLLDRYDRRTVAQLLSDDNEQVPTADLVTNQKLLAILQDATGEFRSALTVGFQYADDDLDALALERNPVIVRLISALAMGYLYERRGIGVPDATDKTIRWAREQLVELQKGRKVLDVVANKIAQNPTPVMRTQEERVLGQSWSTSPIFRPLPSQTVP